MTTQQRPEPQEWIIWNDLLGALDTVAIGKIEVAENGSRIAHLRPPYEMVGPFSLDELETRRFIHFAACVVMSRQLWREQQATLRRDAQEKRRQFARARARERSSRPQDEHGYGSVRRRGELSAAERRRYHHLLELPKEAALNRAAINSAFRRLAKSAHPDRGGSHEAFVRLTEARDALLADLLRSYPSDN